MDSPQVCRVSDQKFRFHTSSSGFLSGELDGTWRKIHSGYLPARVGKRDDICTGAAPNVDCASGFMILDEVEKFRWANTGIPGWLPEIPVVEKEAAEQGLHVLY